jgi:Carboxypeptidase regulatory-like domain/TonB dependent receptor
VNSFTTSCPRSELSRLSILLAACCVSLFGQGSTGSITGLVVDPQQAAVAGADVEVLNQATGVTTQTKTNPSGNFNVPSLAIGTYEVRVSAPGFRTYVQTNAQVEATRTVRIDATLQLGAVGESVTVESAAPLLQTDSAAVGTQVTRQMLNTLPFQLTGASRDPTSFIRLTPGATGGAFGANIAGGRAFASEVLVDGVPVAYNATTNSPDQAKPSYDAVAEFRVEAVIPPAEYGRTSGGVVSMVTRSGTNELHGNVLTLLRNNIFDARRFNASIADITRQAETAGSVGGPVILPKLYNGRNRTFFFVNYTNFRRANVPQGQVATVATEAMRRGDFSEVTQPIYDPMTEVNGVRQQFPNNQIPLNRISPFALRIQEVIPPPNAPGIAGNYIGSAPATQDEDHFLIKIDHQITDKNKFSGNVRYQNNRRTFSRGPLPQVSDGFRDSPNSRNIVLSDDHIIRPNILNRFQAGYTRFDNPTFSSQDIGLQVPNAFAGGFPAVRFSAQGFSNIADTDFRQEFDNNYNFQDFVAWTAGSHNIKFGGRVDFFQQNQRPLGNFAGTYTFAPFATSQPGVNATGHSYASFLLGAVNNASMSYGLPYGIRSRYFSLYAQDDWKVTRKLTVNYGLRWEAQTPWFEVAGRVSQMDPTVPNPGAGGLPGALIFAGEGPGRVGGRGFQKTYFGGIGPRLGLAYQIATNTVIRAGAGIFYAPITGSNLNFQGFQSNISVSSVDAGLTPAFNIDRGWDPALIQIPPFIDPTLANRQSTSSSETCRGCSGKPPRTSQWQMNIQQTLWNTLFEASYVGTVGHGILNNVLVRPNQLHPDFLALGSLLTRPINDPAVVAAGYSAPYPGFTGSLAQALRPFPQYQDITMLSTPTGNSTYHALLVKVEKRYSNGLQFLGAYTFSKTITDIAFDSNGQLSPPQDQYNRRAEKSLANIDRPQRLVLSYLYELPWGEGKPFLNQGIWSKILGGFAISGIHTYQSGAPLRITVPNNLPIFGGHLRPNGVEGVPIDIGPGRGSFEPFNGLSGQQGDLYLNRAAFATPDPFTLGTLPVFLPDVRGPGSIGEDLSVTKRQRLRETTSIEFRADFFNAFNRRNLNNPVTDLTAPNFGRITGQGQPRVIQLGFRLDF